jgi:hypothetical protein
MTTKTPITLPLVHLNGTSAEHLLEGYTAAREAVSAAIHALADAAPNARDYYPIGDHAYAAARREHDARMVALVSVLEDLTRLEEHVAVARDANEGRRRLAHDLSPAGALDYAVNASTSRNNRT